MSHVAPINRFNNTSGPNLENNYGCKGKFTPDQQKERLKLHAVAIATGYPTYEQIVAQWKERFQIEITVQSEKEWRKSNRNKIEKKKQELIEAGEIEVPIVSDKVLADSLNVLMIDNCKLANQVRRKATTLLKDIEVTDLKGDKESSMKTREKLLLFEGLMGAYDKLNTAIVKSFEKMSDLAGRAKMVDAKSGAEDEETVRKLTREDDDEDFNPADVEISEEDRKTIAG
jgi:hypothetical protein